VSLVRPATPADAAPLRMLGLQVFLDTYGPQGVSAALAREAEATFAWPRVEGWFADPAALLLVAEGAGGLTGFAQLALGAGHPLVAGGPSAELQRLYVQRHFLGQGLGRELLLQAEQAARSRGAATLWLTAWVGNARALAFYARQGYAQAGATDHVFEGERFENRVFVKALGAR
jgi:GNAT superfamily N-acetyltransferase